VGRRQCRFLGEFPPHGDIGRFAGFELAGRKLVDVAAGGMAKLAQQADSIACVDGHHRGTTGVAHDFERQAHSIGQIDGVDADLDHAAVIDFFPVEQHRASVPSSKTMADKLFGVLDAWLQHPTRCLCALRARVHNRREAPEVPFPGANRYQKGVTFRPDTGVTAVTARGELSLESLVFHILLYRCLRPTNSEV
jgi:hypothetical protein